MKRIHRSFSIVCGIALIFGFSSCGSSSHDGDYVALGASDATGIGASPLSNGYVFRIADTLDDRCEDTGLVNLGIPGAEADDIEDIEVPAAVEIDPNIITVWAGANDLVGGRSVESFQGDLAAILTSLAVDTDATIFIANLPMLTQLPRFQEDPDPDVTTERVAAFNAAIASEAQAVGAILVDLSNIPISEILVSDDGFHPSDEGHAAIADRFLDQMIPVVCP